VVKSSIIRKIAGLRMLIKQRDPMMLNGVGLGWVLWEKVMVTACYLVNQSASSVLDEKTPHKVWTGKKPSRTSQGV
jgi:hypothetical protein